LLLTRERHPLQPPPPSQIATEAAIELSRRSAKEAFAEWQGVYEAATRNDAPLTVASADDERTAWYTFVYNFHFGKCQCLDSHTVRSSFALSLPPPPTPYLDTTPHYLVPPLHHTRSDHYKY
jgi:hypothetical protein